MNRPGISVTIITLNEERNLPRALESVAWADEIVVVDSGSTDRTLQIAKDAGAKVLTNSWPGWGRQKNFAQDQVANDWVLNIDADEEVPASLAREIQERVAEAAKSPDGPRGFYIPRKTAYLGKWILHGGWYPNYLLRLADRRQARWTEPHLHESLEVRGPVVRMTNPLHHYTFTDVSDQVRTNLRYAFEGSKDLERRGRGFSLPLLLLKPAGKFIETYFFKRGFLDGIPGLIISINAAHSMFLKYAFLYRYEPESAEIREAHGAKP